MAHTFKVGDRVRWCGFAAPYAAVDPFLFEVVGVGRDDPALSDAVRATIAPEELDEYMTVRHIASGSKSYVRASLYDLAEETTC